MARWTIYGKDGNPKAITTGVTVGSRTLPELEYSGTWMGECFVTVTAKSEQPINWQLGDYMLYRGEKFVLNYDPSVIKQARANTYGEAFVYENVKFNSLAVELTDVQFLDVVLSDNTIHYTSLPAFSFFANNIEDLADRLQANCNRYCRQNGFAISDWWIILTPSLTRTVARGKVSGETEDEKTALENLFRNAWNANYSSQDNNETGKLNQNVSVSNQSISQALALIKSTFDLNFVNKGRQVIIGAPARIVGHEFAYGRGNGLHQIERVVDSEQQVITKLIAYGGNTNLPIRYYADINKVCFADVLSIEQGVAKLDVLFSRDRFNGYQDPIVPYPLYKVLFHVDGGQKEGYISDHINQATAGDGSCYLFSSSLEVGDRIYFDSGVVVDKWPSGHFSYVDDVMAIPNNLAVNNLMLPGFPTQSLYDWVIANNGIAVQDGRNNSKYGRATWTYNNVTYDAFFSKDKLNPYILSLNYDSVGIREYTKFFDGSDESDDIYPTIENTGADHLVSADVIEDNGVFEEGATVPDFHITIPSLGQNVEFNSLIKDETTISMKDGYCGGREFKVVSASKNNNGSWDVTLQREPDDALQLYFPYSDKASRGETAIANEAYQLRGSDISGYAGDKFVIIGIDMPATYVEESAKKLLSLALEYLFANQYVRYTYVPKVDEIFMAREHDAATTGTSLHDTLKEGDLMQFEDDDLSIEGNIFIDTLHIKEYGNNGIPTYDVTLKETKTVGTIERIKQQIDSLKVGVGVTYGSATGGLSTSQVKTLISSEGDKRYIRRDVNDETSTELTANKFIAKQEVKTDKIVPKTQDIPVNVGGDLTVDNDASIGRDASVARDASVGRNLDVIGRAIIDQIVDQRSKNKMVEDLESLLGEGFLYKIDEYGKSHVFLDYLTVRLKAYFAELEIRKLSYVGGSIVLTPSGSELAHVKWLDASGNELEQTDAKRSLVKAFKCYSTADNGSFATQNAWAVGDQARCQTFNLDGAGKYQDVSTKYYWRLVTDVGQERVDEEFNTVSPSSPDYDTASVTSYIILSNKATETINGQSGYKGYDPSKQNQDFPEAGDTIVGMGNQVDYNGRGNIIVLRSVSESTNVHAPSFCMYQAVGSITESRTNPFSLTGCDVVDLSTDGFVVQSEFFQFKTSANEDTYPVTLYRGNYSSAAIYNKGHQVTYNNLLWECTANGTSGVTPSESAVGWRKIVNGTVLYTIECSTHLVSTSSLANAVPTVLGAEASSAIYAVAFGEYLLRMAEESEGATAVIDVKSFLANPEGKSQFEGGILTAKNMSGTEVLSTIGTSSDGTIQFCFSDIDEEADHVEISLVVDGEQEATTSIGIVVDGKDGVSFSMDLTNEADLIAVDSGGNTTFAQSRVTQVHLFYGATKQEIDSCSVVFKNPAGNVISSGFNAVITGTDTNEVTVAIAVSDGITVPDIVYVDITAECLYGSLTKRMTIKPMIGLASWQLAPSITDFSFERGEDGETLTPSSISLYTYVSCDDENGKTICTTPEEVAAKDASKTLTIKWGVDDSSTVKATLNVGGLVLIPAAYAASHRCVWLELYDGTALIERETIPINKDGKDGENGSDAEFNDIEDDGSYARVTFEDNAVIDPSTGERTGTSTLIRLHVHVATKVLHVEGDDRSELSDLTGYTLEVKTTHQLTSEAAVVTYSQTLYPSEGAFSYDELNFVASGSPKVSVLTANNLALLNNNVTLILKEGTSVVAILEVPVVIETYSIYNRSKTLMESMYASGGDISVLRQTASELSTKVSKLGEGDSEIVQKFDSIKFSVNGRENTVDLFDHSAGDLTLTGTYAQLATVSTNTNAYRSATLSLPLTMMIKTALNQDVINVVYFKTITKNTAAGSDIDTTVSVITFVGGSLSSQVSTMNGDASTLILAKLEKLDTYEVSGATYLRAVLSIAIDYPNSFKIVNVTAQTNNAGANTTVKKERALYVGKGIEERLNSTGIDIERGKITMRADQLECYNNSNVKTAWMDEFGNFTVAGVFNNLITVIDTDNNIGNDLIITAYYDNGVFYKYVLDEGEDESFYEKRYYIDILRCGDCIVIKSLPSYGGNGNSVNYHLPYFATEHLQDRGHTRFSTGELHMMSSDELRMLVGRRITIKSELTITDNAYTRITGLNSYVVPGSLTIEHLAQDRLYFLLDETQTNFNIPDYNDYSFSLIPQVVHLSFSQVAWMWKPSTVTDGYIKGFGYVWIGGQQDLSGSLEDLEDLNWDQ